jgi:hypothetical protein
MCNFFIFVGPYNGSLAENEKFKEKGQQSKTNYTITRE